MSWIQENRFAAGLGGITAVAAAGLIFWGIKAGGAYNKAKEDYAAAADSVDSMANAALYPSEDNLQAKRRAVTDYERSVADLRTAFDKFRAPTPADVDPAVFSDTLLKAKDAAAKAFADIRPNPVEVPPNFFLGFESYTTSPAKREATGILTYQLEAIGELATQLAAAAPTKLVSIHRPALPEEESQTFDPKGKSFRTLPVELTFTGSEASVRKFLSSLDDSEKFYYVVRSLRITNERLTAPTAADGQFAVETSAAESSGSDSGAFVFPPSSGEAPEEAAAPAATGDGIVLQQVLGAEKLHVFLRIDILQFLEAPKA